MNNPEVWASGEAYEPYVGRWSRRVAAEFVGWLGITGGRWLDVGCGTGALSQTILALAQPLEVQGLDPSEAYVAHTSAHTSDPRASFRVGDARALPYQAATHDAVVSGLVLNFIPQPGQAVAEMARVTKPGGRVAAYVWDYAGKMELMRHFWDAAAALDQAAWELDEGRRFPLCQPQPLADLFAQAGLEDARVQAIEVPTVFRDFDDYWRPFLGGQGPAPGYAMSLSEERRAELREYLRTHLPTHPDGSIHLIARAWAVQAGVS